MEQTTQQMDPKFTTINAIGYREALLLAKQNPKMKFISLKGRIMGLHDLKNVIKGYFGRNLVKTFDDKMSLSFVIISKQKEFTREGKYHSFDCEFATGRSCQCWCGEKYHGMMGAGAKVISTKYQVKA